MAKRKIAQKTASKPNTGKRAAAPRRTQDERRRTTQAAILQAAIDLLVDEGYAKFSTIAVAKRARVSRGARENYFPSKYDLIAAAWDAALVRAKEAARERVQQHGEGSAVDRFLADYESFYLSPVFLALLELQVAARTDKQLSRLFLTLYAEHRQSHDDIWIAAMIAEGYAPTRVRAFVRATQFMLRGMGLTTTWQEAKGSFRAALKDWRVQAPLYLGAPQSQRRSDR